MKWASSKNVENKGLLYLWRLVTDQGSIFRKFHQEEDVGIDGIIEFVINNETTRGLLAVQVKSGDSYLNEDHSGFKVYIDNSHIEYWKNFFLPVVLVCYSPSMNLAAWQPVKEYIEHYTEKRNQRVTYIDVPIRNEITVKTLEEDIYNLSLRHFDERILYKSADMTFSSKANERLQGILQLSMHPNSRDTRLIAFLACRLILDEDIEVSKIAVSVLGHCVAHRKWTFYPDTELMHFAHYTCYKQLDEKHVIRLLELVKDTNFGPMSLGEACMDCIGCMFEPDATKILHNIVESKGLEMYIRANALFVIYGGELDQLIEDKQILYDSGVGDVFSWMLSSD